MEVRGVICRQYKTSDGFTWHDALLSPSGWPGKFPSKRGLPGGLRAGNRSSIFIIYLCWLMGSSPKLRPIFSVITF